MKKCCIKVLVTFLIVVVIVFVGVVVLLNMTPRKLHLSGVSIGGGTIEEYGLADTKILQIIKGVRSATAKESAVVTNGYNAESEAERARVLFEGSTNFGNVTEYSGLLDQNANFNNRYVRTAADTTLAYIVNSAFTNSDALQLAADGFTVSELTITRSQTDEGVPTGHMRVVVSVSVNTILDTAKELLSKFKFIAGLKTLDTLYLVCNADFSVVGEGEHAGKIVFSNVTSTIGKEDDNELTSMFFTMIASSAGAEGDVEQYRTNLTQSLFDHIASIVNHIAEIGNSAANDSGVMVGVKKLGMDGVEDHQLIYITSVVAR